MEAIKSLKKIKHVEWVILLLVAGIGTWLLSSGGGLFAAQNSVEEHTKTELRLGAVLSKIDGAGRVEVFISQDESAATTVFSQSEKQPAAARGVIVVAEGAGDILVKMRLISAVETALGLEPGQVEVFTMESYEEGLK